MGGAPGMEAAPALGGAPGMETAPVTGGGIGGGFCPTVPCQMTPTAMRIATAANSAASQVFVRSIFELSPLPSAGIRCADARADPGRRPVIVVSRGGIRHLVDRRADWPGFRMPIQEEEIHMRVRRPHPRRSHIAVAVEDGEFMEDIDIRRLREGGVGRHL